MISIVEQKRKIFIYVCMVVLALGIPAFIIVIDSLTVKWQVFLLLALFSFFFAVHVPNKENACILLLAFSLCVNFNVTFLASPLFSGYFPTSLGIRLNITDVFLILLYVFWLFRLSKETFIVNRRFITFIIIYSLFLVFSLLSFINSKSILLSIYEFKVRFVVILALFYFAYNIKSSDIIEKILYMIFLGVVISSFIGYVQYIKGSSLGLNIFGETQEFFEQSILGTQGTISRVSGLMLHANMFGIYLILILPTTFSLALADVNMKLKYASFAVSVLGSLALILTFSRASLLSFAAGMFVLVVLKRKMLFKMYNKIVIIFYGSAFIGFLIAFGYKLIKRFTSSPPDQLSYRFILNESALEMIIAHPLLGIGLNNFSYQLRDYVTKNIWREALLPVHNLYLLIASETGILSLTMFLLFIILIIKHGLYLYFYSRDPFASSIGIGIVCGIIAVLISGLVDFTVLLTPIYFLFFTICSLVLIIRFNISEEAL